jgi:hypothetical protein
MKDTASSPSTTCAIIQTMPWLSSQEIKQLPCGLSQYEGRDVAPTFRSLLQT